MSNDSKGTIRLASGWKWVDFEVAEKKLADGRTIRLINREGYIERMPRGGDISWASREAQVVWSHIPNGIHAVRAGATAQRVSVPVAE